MRCGFGARLAQEKTVILSSVCARRDSGLNLLQIGVVAGVLALAGMTLAANAVWGSDFPAARKLALQGGRPILARFTGSDWCPLCRMLDEEVFQQQAFQDYARSNLVLFVADFPSRKQFPERVVRQNEALRAKYQVEEYPAIFLLGADGKVLGQTGYRPDGASEYVEHLQELLGKSGWKKPATAGERGKTKGAAPAPSAVKGKTGGSGAR